MPAERYHSTGQGSSFVVPPMSEARRQHVHGKLLPMERPLADEGHGYDHLPIWDAQLSLPMGTLLLGSVLGIIAAFVLVLGVFHG